MFINIPNNYSSMWGELLYEYSTTANTPIVMAVTNEANDETLAVKKFYSTSSAKINVAPLIFDVMMPKPQNLAGGAITPTVGFPKISVTANGYTTSEKIFTYAKNEVEPPVVLTSMPTNRLLADGEKDQITVLAPVGDTIKYEIVGRYIGSSSNSAPETTIVAINGGAKVITIAADDYNGSFSDISVKLIVDNEVIEQINYAFVAPISASYRVAWLSSKGAIEHYTFPVVEEQVKLKDGATIKSLRSAYGTSQEVDALSEIVSSPALWRVTPSGYSKLGLVTNEIATRRDGALTVVNLKVVEYD